VASYPAAAKHLAATICPRVLEGPGRLPVLSLGYLTKYPCLETY
jgi:hypothetical protein